MIRLSVVPYALLLKRPLDTAAFRLQERRGWWLMAQDDEDRTGFGEVAPLPGFATESHAAAEAALRPIQGRSIAQPTNPDEIADLIRGLGIERPELPTVHAGLELALLDWLARSRGMPLAALLSEQPVPSVGVNGLLTATEPDNLAREARQAVAEGYRTLKLKVGIDAEADEARIQAVREAVGSAIRLRLDANGSWSHDEACYLLGRWRGFDLEYVEQPVAEGLKELASCVEVPIAVDESVRDLDSARTLIAEGGISALILKPMAIGGLLAGKAIAIEAQKAGIATTVTTVLDSAIGVAGALHLAAALGSEYVEHGLGTLGLFEHMPIWGAPTVEQGRMRIADRPGLGVALLENLLFC